MIAIAAVAAAASPRHRCAAAPPDVAQQGPSVTLLLDRAIGAEAQRWLAVHLGSSGASATRRIIEFRAVGEESAEGHWRQGLAEVLGVDEAGWHVTSKPYEEVATTADEGGSITVVTDDGSGRSPGVRWAVRRARGAVLVLPLHAISPVWDLNPRALAVAQMHELPAALAQLRTLPTSLPIDLRVLHEVESDAPACALRELDGARRGLELAAASLRDLGRVVTGDLVYRADVPEDCYSLIIRPARRGLFKGLIPGPDAWACRRRPRPRLLLGPDALRATTTGAHRAR